MDWSLIIILFLACAILMSTIGASIGWFHLKIIKSQRAKAWILYAFHMSTYVGIAIYFEYYEYLLYQNEWLGKRLFEYIIYVNPGTMMWLAFEYRKYFKVENGKIVQRNIEAQ